MTSSSTSCGRAAGAFQHAKRMVGFLVHGGARRAAPKRSMSASRRSARAKASRVPCRRASAPRSAAGVPRACSGCFGRVERVAEKREAVCALARRDDLRRDAAAHRAAAMDDELRAARLKRERRGRHASSPRGRLAGPADASPPPSSGSCRGARRAPSAASASASATSIGFRRLPPAPWPSTTTVSPLP